MPDPTLIPVRMLTQFAYCNRLGYMEWVQGEFETSADVEEGAFRHRRVDEPSGPEGGGGGRRRADPRQIGNGLR